MVQLKFFDDTQETMLKRFSLLQHLKNLTEGWSYSDSRLTAHERRARDKDILKTTADLESLPFVAVSDFAMWDYGIHALKKDMVNIWLEGLRNRITWALEDGLSFTDCLNQWQESWQGKPPLSDSFFLHLWESLQAQASEGLLSSPVEGLPAQASEGLLSSPVEGLPAQASEGLLSSPVEGFPDQASEGLLSSPVEGLPAQASEGLLSSPVEVLPSQTLHFQAVRPSIGGGRRLPTMLLGQRPWAFRATGPPRFRLRRCLTRQAGASKSFGGFFPKVFGVA